MITKVNDNRIRLGLSDKKYARKTAQDIAEVIKVFRGEKGAPGRGIKEIVQLDDDSLVITFTDDFKRSFKLPRGKDGKSIVGPRGLKGNVGKAGKTGKGIESISQPTVDTMLIEFTDGTNVTLELPRGEDGREIELRATKTHIQWKYTDEREWRNLISLGALLGVSEGAGSLKIKLRMLTDIDWTTLQDGYVLAFNQAGNNFIWVPPGSGGGGTTWYDGSGAPAGGLGVNGDYYLDVDTGDVYKKVAGVWGIVGNIQGPAGTPGSVWHNGTGAPAGGLGVDGDYYLNNANGDVYFKASGSWSIIANITGPAGANGTNGTNGTNGAPGSVWYNGSGAPAGGLGINGDYYLDTASGDVYFKAAGVWGVIANIEGPQGIPGVSIISATRFSNADATLTSTAPALYFWAITSAGPWTATFPAAPNDGEWFILGSVGIETLQLDGQSIAITNLFDESDLEASGVSPGASFLCVYDAGTNAWLCTPMGQPHKYVENAYRSIFSQNNPATPNTKVDVTIAEIVLTNAAGDQKVKLAASYTIDAGTTGANGLDAGSLANNTWYYHFIIMKGDGTTAGLMSTSRNSPTLPTGYTYKAFVGTYRTQGTAIFLATKQYDNRVFYVNRLRVLTAGNATTETAASVAIGVPPEATDYDLSDAASLTGTAGGLAEAVLEYRIVTGVTYNQAFLKLSSLAASQTNISQHSGNVGAFPNIGQQFFYLWTVTSGSAQAATAYVQSYRLYI